MTDEPDDRPERVPFAQALQDMRKGNLHTELGDELAALVVKCRETLKQGSITLTLTVAPQADGDMVFVSDKIAVKTPRPDTGATAFWSDTKGNLSRSNPNQQRLPLRGVNGGKTNDEDADATSARETQ